jgi:hypothetical protein
MEKIEDHPKMMMRQREFFTTEQSKMMTSSRGLAARSSTDQNNP